MAQARGSTVRVIGATCGVAERAAAMHDGQVGLLPPPPPDDDDRRRSLAGGSPGAEHPRRTDGFRNADLLGLRIPDDLRGLEDEIRAVQAELGIFPGLEDSATSRRARLFRRLRHWPPPGGLGRSLLVGPIVAVTLLLIAGLVALLPATGPGATRRIPAPARLASPAQPPGTVGGLLPDVGLDSPMGAVPARGLRPAVLMLVPDNCNCPALVHDMVGQVAEYPGIGAALVGSGDPSVAQLAVAREGGNGRLPALVDRSGALARAYHGGPPGSAPTVLIVAPDGVLIDPPLAFTPGTRLEAALLPLGQLRA